MNVTFTLQQDNGVGGFIDTFEVVSPTDVGRYDFQVSSSLSSYVHLRQISRKFFSIKEDLNVVIHSQNITHFQFLDDSDNIIDIIDNKLQKPLMDGFILKVASYVIENSNIKSQTFKQKAPVIYKINIKDQLDFDSDYLIEPKKKTRKKEVADLICPYCDKAFKQLSRHIKICKERPSDRARPTPDSDGFIPKKRNW